MIEKRFTALSIVSLIIVIAVLAVSVYPFQAIVKEFGGKYDAKVSYYGDNVSWKVYLDNSHSGEYDATIHYYGYRVQLTYTDETGSHTSANFDNALLDGLNWINSSTPENATFLCWWDSGHMIKAIGERNPIVRNPSREIINSIADPSGIREFDSHEKIFDVASAFTTNDPIKLVQIMEKYDAKYVMVGKNDLTNSMWFFKIADLNYADYVINQRGRVSFTELGKDTMIAKLLENNIVDSGLTLVYQDQEMKIYQLER